MTNQQKKQFKVLAILPRHDKPGEEWFMKVGSGFENRDASITMFLNAIPCTGTVKLQLRELDARDLAQRETYRGAHSTGNDRGSSPASSRAATAYSPEPEHGGANGPLPF